MPTDPLTIIERQFLNDVRKQIESAEEAGALAERGQWTNDQMKEAMVIIDRLVYLLPGQGRRENR